jgi:DNA polymerase
MTTVPNLFPTTNNPTRLAIIGEAPGELEEAYGKPFVGPSGKLITSLLIQAGLRREDVFLGNVCQVRPPGNDMAKVDRDMFELGKQQLAADLNEFAPRVCLLLGGTALQAAGVTHSVSAYRGTVFICQDVNSPFFQRKCIASYHPSYVLRGNGRDSVVLFTDVKRAVQEMAFESVAIPQRNYELNLTPMQIIERLEDIERNKLMVSFDIEGGVNGVSCCGIATESRGAFIVPFFYGQKTYFTERESAMVMQALSRMLMNPDVPKILQNSLYDSFVMAWVHKIVIRNVKEDTMLKHWELYPEMEKGLGFQTSYYTNEPYYKAERGSITADGFFTYCCKDAAITYEICHKQASLLQARPEGASDHYRFNMAMLRPLLYMELRGIRYDSNKAYSKVKALEAEMSILQAEINQFNKGKHLNVKSPKQMVEFLQAHNLPVPLNRKTGRPTANYEAILNLAKKTGLLVLTKLIGLKEKGTRVQMLNIRSDDDGRIRCGYNVVGTETGRLTCYTSPTGSGYNLQTITEADRDNFLADEGHYFFQCDLSGADAWTVAAWAKNMGDSTMLDDLLGNIKVAKVIAAMFKFGPEVAKLDRDTLRGYTDQIPKSDPIYFASKCVQHGSNYGMGKVLMSAVIFTQSSGDVNMKAADCQRLQDLYFQRYPGIKRWHAFVRARISTSAKFVSASGHTRQFTGDPNDHNTFKQGLANEPQENTTYATNKAALRLWQDPENRRENGSLIIEPLHQVHDALCGQFPQDKTEWAVRKIREYFSNEIEVAGEKITIPFEGAYGPSWGELNVGNI